MQQFVIYGAGKIGKYIINKSISQGFRECIKAVYDIKQEDLELKNKYIDIKSPLLLFREEKDINIIVALENQIMMQKVVLSLFEIGFNNIFLVDHNMIMGEKNPLDVNGGFSIWIKKYNEVMPVLPFLDYQVVDYCNLNCKGCFHHTNYKNDNLCESIESYIKSLNLLKVKFRNIDYIRLMGGEPLLADNLDEYIIYTRKIFPFSNIDIVTNGILIRKISERLLKIIRENRVKIAITQYPTMIKMQENNILFLREHNLEYSLSPVCDTFHISLSRFVGDYRKSFSDCINKYDYFLRNGSLSACARIQMAYEMKEELKLDYSKLDYEKSVISLMDDIDGWEILRKLSQAVPMCKYCTDYKTIKWSVDTDDFDAEAYFVDKW